MSWSTWRRAPSTTVSIEWRTTPPQARSRKVSLRTAACVLAIGRVGKATVMRGI
jgi:glutamate dehydrogenase (NAD(P)+)